MDNANRFLDEIKRLSEAEKSEMLKEIDELRKSEYKKAEAKGRADAAAYTEKALRKAEAEITGEYAVKNLESDSALFKRRDGMIRELFAKAEKKLADFTKAPEYREKLLKDAREISAAFGSNECILYISEKDLRFSDEIKACFNSITELKVDNEIKIGGIKGYCPALRIIADNTLDSKLQAQKKWFVENAKLRV